MPKLTISFSYSGNVERLVRSISSLRCVSKLSIVGREVIIEANENGLGEVKRELRKLGVEEPAIIGWRRPETTLSNSGKGEDEAKVVRVTLIPSETEEGIKALALLADFEVEEGVSATLRAAVETVLRDAGVTSALYVVNLLKQEAKDVVRRSAVLATLNALRDAGGVVSVEKHP